ncbi:MAG: hypothetical protein R3C53_19715 [Pirellulaceae bacterium]
MKLNKLFIPLVLLSLSLVAGCGPSGGAAGDANDPAATSDDAQMQSETGDV